MNYNELVSKYEFTDFQKEELKKISEFDFDLEIFTKLDLNYMQLREIRFGLEKGLDVTSYLNPVFNSDQMVQIREELESNK